MRFLPAIWSFSGWWDQNRCEHHSDAYFYAHIPLMNIWETADLTVLLEEAQTYSKPPPQ